MILLAASRSEAPLARVAHELDRLGVPTMVLQPARVRGRDLRVRARRLRAARRAAAVAQHDSGSRTSAAAYTRLMDDRILPELDSEPPDSPARTACRELHDTLYRWMEITPARVVNRASAMASNGSKPYQAQLIARAGFAVPETLVTNDPELVRAFFAQHGRVVYKSVSGSRSIVQELTGTISTGSRTSAGAPCSSRPMSRASTSGST